MKKLSLVGLAGTQLGGTNATRSRTTKQIAPCCGSFCYCMLDGMVASYNFVGVWAWNVGSGGC